MGTSHQHIANAIQVAGKNASKHRYIPRPPRAAGNSRRPRFPTHREIPRFERVPPVMPRRDPARLTSWQGEPPEIMSTGGTVAQSTAVTSRKFLASGKCCARIFDGASSNSHTHAVVAFSACSTASARPPYPAKSSPAVS